MFTNQESLSQALTSPSAMHNCIFRRPVRSEPIKQLVHKKELLKLSAGGYKLAHKIRDRFDCIYGKARITVKVADLLAGLADTIPNMAERDYYKEALNCYKHGSPRAAVVMTWSIAFSHPCDHVLAKCLADFNSQWLKTCPGMHKNKTKTITAFNDFNDELKESKVLKICRDAGTSDQFLSFDYIEPMSGTQSQQARLR
jgi:hypothetical protein